MALRAAAFGRAGSVGRFLDVVDVSWCRSGEVATADAFWRPLQAFVVAPSLQAQADSAEMGRAFSTFRITPKAPLQPAECSRSP